MTPRPSNDDVPSDDRPAIRRAAVWAALLVFLTAGYFQNSRPGWNVHSQFALACALAERGTFRIDAYHDVKTGGPLPTEDKAFHEGHYYCDKSPVTAFLAVPVVWLHRRASLLLGIPFDYAWTRWLATWLVVGGSAAALTAMLVLALCARGVPPTRAARGAVLWLAATPLLGYSVLFINYLPAGAMLLAAFLLAAPAWRDRAASPGRLLAAGLLAGLSAWTLNSHALPALVLTALVAVGPPNDRWPSESLRRLTPWIAGMMVGVAGYFVYNRCLFGSFRSPYVYEAEPFFREQMARGLMGAGWPRPLVLWLVTLHPFQGLLFWWPLTALALAGCGRMLARGARADRLEASAALATFLGLWLYVGGYFMWWGGWAYAPRHLIPALPLLALGLAPWLRGRRPWPARLLLGVGVLGAILNVAAVAVDPQTPPGLPQEALLNPASVAHGPSPMLRLQEVFWLKGYADANWGGRLGLAGPASLLPLALLWCLAWWWLPRWVARRAGRPAGGWQG